MNNLFTFAEDDYDVISCLSSLLGAVTSLTWERGEDDFLVCRATNPDLRTWYKVEPANYTFDITLKTEDTEVQIAYIPRYSVYSPIYNYYMLSYEYA